VKGHGHGTQKKLPRQNYNEVGGGAEERQSVRSKQGTTTSNGNRTWNWDLGPGFWVLGSGFWVQDLGLTEAGGMGPLRHLPPACAVGTPPSPP